MTHFSLDSSLHLGLRTTESNGSPATFLEASFQGLSVRSLAVSRTQHVGATSPREDSVLGALYMVVLCLKALNTSYRLLINCEISSSISELFVKLLIPTSNAYLTSPLRNPAGVSDLACPVAYS